MIAILLGTGFEEAEALVPCDLLRRAGLEVRLVGLDGDTVAGGHGIRVQADCRLEDVRPEELQMLVLPGGTGGVASIRASEPACALIRATVEAGRYLAAICAAPTLLAELGLTEGRLCTCYPTLQDQMEGAVLVPDAEAVQDGKLITGTAAGMAIPFALQLITALCGRDAAQKVADEIVYRA